MTILWWGSKTSGRLQKRVLPYALHRTADFGPETEAWSGQLSFVPIVSFDEFSGCGRCKDDLEH